MYVLSELFGGCPQVKVVETFTEHYEDVLSVPEIERMTDVSKATVYSHTKNLLEEGMVKKAGKVGKTQLYQLNIENTKAKIILMLERYIVSERLEQLIEKERIEEPVVVTELAGDLYNTTSVPSANTSLSLFFRTRDDLIPSWRVGSAVMGGVVVATSPVGEQAYYTENV
ncbi:MAG: helix-turn-helix domain-containing protein [Euryarchaeota archaeon]|nr:helix-turn-helix domain-containing protein [Euryarchaeota archaeon]